VRRFGYGQVVVEAGGTTGRSDSSRHQPAKPQWWAVLAVALGLMALVVAFSGSKTVGQRVIDPTVVHLGLWPGTSAALEGSPGTSPGDGAARRAGGARLVTLGTTHLPGVSGGTTASNARAATPSATATASGKPTAGDPGTPAGKSGTGDGGATTVTTTPASPTGTVPGGTGGRAPPTTTTTTITTPVATTTTVPGNQDESGNLVFPYDLSDYYNIDTVGGIVQATATWSGTEQMTLTIACNQNQQSRTGTSGFTLAIETRSSICSVEIAVPPEVTATVSFQLNIQYTAY
jgi:hypothetical protein